MKRRIFSLLLAVAAATGAYAQFESGKVYFGANLTGAGISYSDRKDLALGVGLEAGRFVARDWLLIGECNLDYRNSDWQSIGFGVKGRYYIEQNGLWVGAGARFQHEFKNYNDFVLTPEVGYCFFVSRTVAIQPSVYFDLSCSDFSHNTEVGAKVGIALFFDGKKH